MPDLDIFLADAFRTRELTFAFEKIDYLPTMARSVVQWQSPPLMTTTLMIEERDQQLTLIPTSVRGSAPESRPTEKRKMRSFETVRIANSAEVQSHEVQNVRQFGNMALQTMQQLVLERGAAARRDIEYTWENMAFGALQGLMIDSDGSTLVNFFTEFGVSAQNTIAMALGTATTNVRKKCHQIRRTMQLASKGAWLPNTRVGAFVGDAFFDDLIDHDHVRSTFINWQAAADLRQAQEWRSFTYGDVEWMNYRGADSDSVDGTAGQLTLETNTGFAFPINAPGVFQWYWGPGESEEWVNQIGRPVYTIMVPDRDRGFKRQIEHYSYPFPICTRPRMLIPLARNT